MNEFFDASTNNHRKREIGIYLILKTQFWSGCTAHCVAMENNRNLAVM